MSQLITELPVGSLIKIPETNSGVTHNIPWRIVANTTNNPYGNDKILCVREYVTTEYYTQNGPRPQKSSYVDSYMDSSVSAILNRMDASFQRIIPTVSVACYDKDNEESYTIDRKIFSLSYNELGGSNSDDSTENIPYFNENAKRILRDESTKTGQRYVTRTFFLNHSSTTTTNMGISNVSASGGLSQSSTSNYSWYFCAACNVISTTLVSDEPDEDGYYALIPDPTDPYLYVRFDASLGSVAKTPLKIRVDLTTEGNPEITSLQVCNNYGDTNPTWENMTVGEKHTFTNTSKTSDNWEIGVKVEARGENTIRVYEPFAIVQTEVDE